MNTINKICHATQRVAWFYNVDLLSTNLFDLLLTKAVLGRISEACARMSVRAQALAKHVVMRLRVLFGSEVISMNWVVEIAGGLVRVKQSLARQVKKVTEM